MYSNVKEYVPEPTILCVTTFPKLLNSCIEDCGIATFLFFKIFLALMIPISLDLGTALPKRKHCLHYNIYFLGYEIMPFYSKILYNHACTLQNFSSNPCQRYHIIFLYISKMSSIWILQISIYQTTLHFWILWMQLENRLNQNWNHWFVTSGTHVCGLKINIT